MSTTAKISWIEGALFVAEAGSGHHHHGRRPDSGGRNLASRPMEVVLMGMGGCTAIDVVGMLKKQRQDILGVEVSLVAERADDHPKVFTSVKLVYRCGAQTEQGLGRAGGQPVRREVLLGHCHDQEIGPSQPRGRAGGGLRP